MSDIDLHIHTSASQDGELSPREVFEEARKLGLRAIAFADHDSVAAVGPGVKLSREFGIDFAPAVEITTRLRGYDPHLLGYFIDWRSPALGGALEDIGQALRKQAETRVARLRHLGFQIDIEDVFKASEGRHPTTAAIFTTLKATPANFAHPEFARYIAGDRSNSPVYNFYRDWFCAGKPAFVELETLTMPEAVRLVHDLGGVAVMAHPGRTPMELLDELCAAGLDGLEVYCSTHTKAEADRFGAYARAHALLVTAGSDYHGPTIKPDIRLGQLTGGEYAMFEALQKKGEEIPMKCGSCDNEATIHITEIRRGLSSDRHLCEKCAEMLLPLEESDYSEYLESLPQRHSTEVAGGSEPTKEEIEMTGVRQRVVVVDLRTGETESVGLRKGDSFSPVWSPDSSRLAMCHSLESLPSLVVVEPGKSGLRRFMRTTYSEPANWSRDSHKIVFSHADEGSSIVIADAAEGTTRRIASAPGINDFAPAWSPRDNRIAFVGFAMDQENVSGSTCSAFIVDAGSGKRRLVRALSASFMMSPRWSSDARFLALTSMPFTGADPDAILSAAAGQVLHVVLSDAEDARATEVRDDCQSFAWVPRAAGFSGGPTLLALVTVKDEPAAELVLIDPDTRRTRSMARDLVFPAGEVLPVHMTSDGTMLVATRGSRADCIAFMDVKSGEIRELDPRGEVAWLGWHPEGKRVVSLIRTDAGVSLREFSPEGVVREITEFPRKEFYDAPVLALSGDGTKAAVELHAVSKEWRLVPC